MVTGLCDAGYNAVYLCEPTTGPYGRQLRQLLVSEGDRNPEEEFRLFLLDRQEDVEQNIKPVLQAGGIVCIDRYYISSMAYQGALGLDPEVIRRENERFSPAPDLILHFSVPVDTALDRIASSRAAGANQFEKRDYLVRVNEILENLAFPQLVSINAEAEPDEVYETALELVWGCVKHPA